MTEIKNFTPLKNVLFFSNLFQFFLRKDEQQYNQLILINTFFPYIFMKQEYLQKNYFKNLNSGGFSVQKLDRILIIHMHTTI